MVERRPIAVPHLRSVGGMILISAVSACSEPVAPPTASLLLGQWGSTDAEVIAIRAGAEVRMACSIVIIEAPISLTPEQSFATHGHLSGSGAQLGALPVVSVTGTVSGTQLRISFPTTPGAEPATHVLEAGVKWPPTDRPECPL